MVLCAVVLPVTGTNSFTNVKKIVLVIEGDSEGVGVAGSNW
jgi:hypothetical protein